MNISQIETGFSTLFSDEKVTQDFYNYASSKSIIRDGIVEYTLDGIEYRVPVSTKLQIVTRVAQIDVVPSCVEIRILAAVGGVLSEKNGIVVPCYFFTKLYYNESLQLTDIEVDTSQFAL